MGFFGNKKQSPMPEASETIGLSLTPDEIDLLRECSNILCHLSVFPGIP